MAQSPSDSNGTAGALDPRNSYDVNIHFGTLLPSRIGLLETVPGWGIRLSAPTGKGTFEASGFSGIGNGIIYKTAALDYRMDVAIETISAHFVLGLHIDQYEAENAASRFSGGWHYGGGITQLIAGPVFGRFDFRHRFSPGQVLEVTLGLTYRFAVGGGGQ